MAETIEITYSDENGDEIAVIVPSKFEVCDRCEGHGTHLNPSIGEHAYSSEEFYEAFPEEEDRAEYFRHGGIYDVTCETCKGNRVVKSVDFAACNKEQKEHVKKWREEQREIEAERRAEMRTMRYENGDFGEW